MGVHGNLKNKMEPKIPLKILHIKKRETRLQKRRVSIDPLLDYNRNHIAPQEDGKIFFPNFPTNFFWVQSEPTNQAGYIKFDNILGELTCVSCTYQCYGHNRMKRHILFKHSDINYEMNAKKKSEQSLGFSTLKNDIENSNMSYFQKQAHTEFIDKEIEMEQDYDDSETVVFHGFLPLSINGPKKFRPIETERTPKDNLEIVNEIMNYVIESVVESVEHILMPEDVTDDMLENVIDDFVSNKVYDQSPKGSTYHQKAKKTQVHGYHGKKKSTGEEISN